MRTSLPQSGRSASWRGRTRTAPAPSPAAGRSRRAGPDPALCRLPARRVRRHRQRPCLRQHLGGAQGTRVVVPGGLRPGPAAPGQGRDRFRSPLVQARCGDPVAARRRPDRGRVHIARTLIGSRHFPGLRSPDGGGCTGGTGESRLAHRERGVVVSGGWITQADRARWQRDAVRELAVILAGHPDLPVLAKSTPGKSRHCSYPSAPASASWSGTTASSRWKIPS